ncbi:16S rRNA m(7)G-527 methyltransferase [Jatrophihabitans sp. GAS493]|uniref:16S rRNA (guanine(527)-N(7))-methyltransferase RsmG n=1 Tax=Jatrophihabitans sp. GAS493 TaxID=1907575 RepID=UPI000BB7588E|nr:16S rRNA (guanine(527)-N(7))-methyltransferase RsmG [Jatrophihabitans sp. GAS493]SOD71231.1 16S rRNA m(7)G-527 methyltransferase [Jatrophihabitans sp. GAS493]
MREVAELVFGERLPIAQRFADFLSGPGLDRGLMGPRELPRIWDRHLLNCAVLTELLPIGARVVDIGSGAGLPGLVLACRRPDLRVDLVESLQRRVDFLNEAVELLELGDSVRVVRGRAEDSAVVAEVGSAEWVTARAVAPLDRLVRWCLPLLDVGGSLLAMKGESADQELVEHRTVIKSLGGSAGRLVECGFGVITPPLRVVIIEREKFVRPKKGRVSR